MNSGIRSRAAAYISKPMLGCEGWAFYEEDPTTHVITHHRSVSWRECQRLYIAAWNRIAAVLEEVEPVRPKTKDGKNVGMRAHNSVSRKGRMQCPVSLQEPSPSGDETS